MSRLNRRSYLRALGAAVGVIATGFTVNEALTDSGQRGTTESPRPTVEINEGDDLAPVLKSVRDGDTVVLPRGTYTLTDTVHVDANDWTFHGNGSVLKTSGRPELLLSGYNWDFGYLAIEPQNESNPDAWCRIRVPNRQSPATDTGSGDWRLHHLAWTRVNRTRFLPDDDRRMGSILPGIDRGASAEISDCWFGSGVDLKHGKSQIHCWNILDGELWVRRTYFQESGVYGANSTDSTIHNRGTTNFEDCYFEDSYLGAARTGGHFQDTHIRNCVMNCTGLSNVPTRREISGQNFRGVWAWHGPVILENTHIKGAGDLALDVAANTHVRRVPSIDYRSGEFVGSISNEDRVTIDPSVGHDPTLTPPEACVTSAEEAYLSSE